MTNAARGLLLAFPTLSIALPAQPIPSAREIDTAVAGIMKHTGSNGMDPIPSSPHRRANMFSESVELPSGL